MRCFHPAALLIPALAAVVIGSTTAHAQPDPRWDDRFPLPGVDGVVRAAAWFQGDLYIAGEFTQAGGLTVNHIARWDGRGWHAVGGGVSAGVVVPILTSLAVYDDALIVGGFFSAAGGVDAFSLARWDGSEWTEFAGGVGGEVDAILPVGDDLYVGGTLATVGDIAARRVARWDGEAWHALGGGIGTVSPGERVLALAHDGAHLYAAGDIRRAGDMDVNNIARWDGETWSAMGEGADAIVHALAVFNGELYAGGRFTEIGGEVRPRLARWTGEAWTAASTVVGTTVRALTARGGALYVGGVFTEVEGAGPGLAVFDGAAWTGLGAGISGEVYTVAVDPDGKVAAAGEFPAAGDRFVHSVSVYADARWHTLGAGVEGRVRAVQPTDGGYYVGGDFSIVGGTRALNLAFWDGTTWSPVGEGMDGPVLALAEVGDLLYAAGDFSHVGEMEASHIAVWDGGAWSPVGGGLGAACRVLIADEDGVLYAGGNFNNAGETATGRIARWNGEFWSALGSGIPAPGIVNTLALSGTALIAGGFFTTAGGVDAANIARYQEGEWTPLGSGTNGEVVDLAVDSTGVYAVGDFLKAGGNDANGFAYWDGQEWSAGFSAGIDARPITAVVVAGPDSVYIGGAFAYILDEPFSSVALLSDSLWHSLGAGIDGAVDVLLRDGNDLYVGGTFHRAGDFASANFARWSIDAAVPVELLSLDARRTADGVELSWRVADPEGDLLGFHVHRESPDGARERLTGQPLFGGDPYRYLDRSAPRGNPRYWLAALTRSGGRSWFGPVSTGLAPPARLLWSRPNPFRGSTRVGYRVERTGPVTLEVFDLAGRLVRVLDDGVRNPGDHEIAWDGADGRGVPAGSGVFFYRLRTPEGVATLRIVALP